jgi:hypothetical protein
MVTDSVNECDAGPFKEGFSMAASMTELMTKPWF